MLKYIFISIFLFSSIAFAHEIRLILKTNSTGTVYVNKTFYPYNVFLFGKYAFASLLLENDIFSIVAENIVSSMIMRNDEKVLFSFTTSDGKFKLQFSNTTVENIRRKYNLFSNFSKQENANIFLVLLSIYDIVNNFHLSPGPHTISITRIMKNIKIGEET